MGRTESIFASVLLAAIAIAVVVVLARNSGPAVAAAPVQVDRLSESDPEFGDARMAFTGDEEDDICVCYQQAYAYGAAAYGIQSREYRGGFAACTNMLGTEGSDAWSWGHRNASQGDGPRSCRGYVSQRRRVARLIERKLEDDR